MPYTTYDLSDLRTLLQNRYEGIRFWTNEEARLALNEALRLWNLMTGEWRDTVGKTFTTPPPNDPYVAFPAPLVFPLSVRWNGKPLRKASVWEMDQSRPHWETETTADGLDVPDEPRYWMPISLKLIAVWPIDASGGTLAVDGIVDTPVLVDDTDEVDISEASFTPILLYALHVLLLKVGGQQFVTSQSSLKAFVAAAGEENEQFKASTLYKRVMQVDMQKSYNPVTLKKTQ